MQGSSEITWVIKVDMRALNYHLQKSYKWAMQGLIETILVKQVDIGTPKLLIVEFL